MEPGTDQSAVCLRKADRRRAYPIYSDVDILVHVKLNCQVTNVAIQASFITFISHPESSSWKTSL